MPVTFSRPATPLSEAQSDRPANLANGAPSAGKRVTTYAADAIAPDDTPTQRPWKSKRSFGDGEGPRRGPRGHEAEQINLRRYVSAPMPWVPTCAEAEQKSAPDSYASYGVLPRRNLVHCLRDQLLGSPDASWRSVPNFDHADSTSGTASPQQSSRKNFEAPSAGPNFHVPHDAKVGALLQHRSQQALARLHHIWGPSYEVILHNARRAPFEALDLAGVRQLRSEGPKIDLRGCETSCIDGQTFAESSAFLTHGADHPQQGPVPVAGHANSATQTRAESGAPPPPTALDPAFVLKLFLDQMNQLRQDLDGVQNSQRRWMSDLLADQAGRLERQHATNFGLMHEQGESMQREFAACLAQQAEQMRQAHLAELLAQATRLRAVAQTQVREQGEALRQEAAENLRAEAERLRAELRPAPVDAPASHEKASPTSQPRPPADKSRAKNADDTRTSRLDDNRLRRNLPKWAYDVAAEPFYAHLRRGFWDAPGWKNCLFAAPKAALSALLYLVDQFAAMVAWLHASGMLNLMNMMLSIYLRAPRVA